MKVAVSANKEASIDAALEPAFDQGTDLIILDRGLPDGDGLEFLRQLRSEGVGAGVLVISERSAINDRVAGLDAGADDYLVKPFAFAELVARCRALLLLPTPSWRISPSRSRSPSLPPPPPSLPLPRRRR